MELGWSGLRVVLRSGLLHCNGATKIVMLEGVLAVVAAAHPARQILCGDFNLPQLETVEGQIVTWAERVGSTGSAKMRRRWRGAGSTALRSLRRGRPHARDDQHLIRQQHSDAKVLYLTAFSARLFKETNVLRDDKAFLEKLFTARAIRDAVSLLLFGHPRGLVPRAGGG